MTAVAVARGTCFGFEVVSPLSFNYLRGGSGEQLTVTEGDPAPAPSDDEKAVLHWTPPAAPLDARLFGNEDAYRLWVDRSGWFSIDVPGRRITVPPDNDPVRREERLWGIPSVLNFAARGDIPLHAAAVQIGSRAVVIAAPGRFGKTTMAAGFAEAGFRVLSEDLSCLRLGDQASVVPGPAMLRLRRDVADHFDLGWGSVIGEHEDRVHIALDRRQRGTCAPVPLAALILLRWSDGPARLEPHAGMEALADLWTLSFHLPSSEGRLRCFKQLTALADQVPVFNLWRRQSFDDMRTAVDLVADLCDSATPRAKERLA